MRACNCCSIEKTVCLPDPRLPDPVQTVGDHIRKHRLVNGWTQAEVAEDIGYTDRARPLGDEQANAVRAIPAANHVVSRLRTGRCGSGFSGPMLAPPYQQ
jgi:hypothetical protein